MGSGCDGQRPSPDEPGDGPAQPAAECPGATAADLAREYHPRLLRGRVLAPSGQLSLNTPIFEQLDGWLVGTAHAAPLEDEQPVGGVRVFLYRVGPAGEPSGAPLRQTTTDANGEWCMKLPEGVEFGADLVAQAKAGQTRLRRSVVSEFATDIYSASEALTQLLAQRDVDFTKISTETYFNMESIAATAIDLLEPVELAETDGVEAAVRKIRDVLEKDERLMEKLQVLQRVRE
ncbi:MAG: hypothetical protein ACOC9J_03295 [Persicimonas sp.]